MGWALSWTPMTWRRRRRGRGPLLILGWVHARRIGNFCSTVLLFSFLTPRSERWGNLYTWIQSHIVMSFSFSLWHGSCLFSEFLGWRVFAPIAYVSVLWLVKWFESFVLWSRIAGISEIGLFFPCKLCQNQRKNPWEKTFFPLFGLRSSRKDTKIPSQRGGQELFKKK